MILVCPAAAAATIINQPPVANAGVDQTVVQRSSVFLNGSASYDPDGLIAKALWRQISGTPVTLVNSGQLTASFTAPRVTANSIILVFELTVTDDDGVTASDQVTIMVVKK